MLTARDPLADAVDVCAELGRILETVRLSGFLVAPAMLEAAAVAGGGEVKVRAWGKVRRGESATVVSLEIPGSDISSSVLMHAHVHTRAHTLSYVTCAAGAVIIRSRHRRGDRDA